MPSKYIDQEGGKSTENAGFRRRQFITIEESHLNIHVFLEKKSLVITGRNHFIKDDCILDYEMDFEDERAEQYGKDFDKKDVEEEFEDEKMDNEEEEEVGIIVSDGHLSVCEYDFSQDGQDDEHKQKEIALRRERIKKERQ